MSSESDPEGLKVDILSRVAPFSQLSPERIAQIARIARIERYKLGEKLFSEGDQGNKFYIVVEGKVRIGRSIVGMGEEALDILEAGQYFGELALIDEGPRSADAVVHQSCVLLSITQTDFEELLMLNQQLAYEVLWEFCRVLAKRLRAMNDKLTFLAVSSKFE
jgi:CRP-like cAMP-binding protein